MIGLDLNIVEAASPLIELAIKEDIGPGDATSEAVLPSDLTLKGDFIAKFIILEVYFEF